MAQSTVPMFLQVLRNRNFFLLWVSQITSQLAMNMTLFLLGLIVYHRTGSNTAVSGLFLAFGIPSVLFGMIAGALVNRFDKRSIIYVSGVIRALLACGFFLTSHNVFIVYILLFFNALVTQFFVPSEASLIPQYVSAAQLVTANSLFSFAYYSSMAVGFIAAGPFLRFAGNFPSLSIVVLLFLLSGICGLQLPKDKTKNVRPLGHFFRHDVFQFSQRITSSIQEGFVYVMHSPRLFDSVLLLTGTQIIIAMLGTLGPGFADKVMNIDIRDASLIIIGPAVLGIILGGLWVGNYGYKFKSKRLIESGIVGAGTILLLISVTVYLKRFSGFDWLFTDSLIIPLELMLFFFLGIANSLLDVPANSILQKEAEGEMLTRVYGFLSATVGGVGILPVLIGGILADVIGVGKVIFLLGFCVVLYGMYHVRYSREG